VVLALIDRSRAMAKVFVATEHEEPEEWQNVASLATADLWLTVLGVGKGHVHDSHATSGVASVGERSIA
jgi:hypothetical protein